MVAVSGTLEVEFVPGSGTWVNLSDRVMGKVQIVRPRVRATEDQATTTLEATLYNSPDASGYCPLSPDNPAGAYFPNVTRDRRVRFTATWTGGPGVRFLGWADAWTPDAGDRPPSTATVTLNASCVLSRYARRRTLSMFGEYAMAGLPASNFAYYPWDDDPDSTILRVCSPPGASVANPGYVIQPKKMPGSMTVNAPDGGHLTDGQLDFTRGDNESPSPVVLIELKDSTTNALYSISGWYRVSADPSGSTGDDIISAYDKNGVRVWVWTAKITAGKVVWTLYDDNGVAHSYFDTNSPRDDGWHYYQLRFSGAVSALFAANKGEGIADTRGYGDAASGSWVQPPNVVQYLVIGGHMPPFRRGKQSNTLQGSVSSLLIQYNAGFTYLEAGNPGVVNTGAVTRALLNLTSTSTDALVGGSVGTGADTTPMLFTNSTRDLLARWNELARTVSGNLITRTDGKREWRTAAQARSTTVSLTLRAEEDLSAPDGGWGAVKDERPTRVTVSSPLGSFTAVDTVTETATGLQLEGPNVSSAAGLDGVAKSIAGRILTSGGVARMASFGCDVTATSSDITTAVMSLQPGQRLRITGLPVATEGFTYKDVYANGWTEVYDGSDSSVRFQFDTDPADDPPDGIFDDATYGRFGLPTGTTATGGTAVGTTATGTLVLSSALTATGGSYPLDLNWNGERITMSAAGTVSARGVAPSVARIHTAGETVDLWQALTFGA